MSAVLTDTDLEAVWTPPGDVGEELASAFERTIQAAAGQDNAMDARMVQLVRRALLEGFWRHRGCHSPEQFCTAQLGWDWPRARRVVRIALELGDYPETAAQFARGLLTEAHVYEIVTRVDPAREVDVATVAGRWNIGQLRRWSANFAKPVEEPEPEPPVAEGEDREEPDPFELPPPDPTPTRVDPDVIAGTWNDQNRFVGRFDLGVELGSLMEKTMKAGQSKVFTERTGIDPEDDDRAGGAAQVSWADALERVLHGALHSMDPDTAAGERPGDRYQVMVHLDLQHLEASRIHLGPTLTKAQRQYFTCDADLRVLLRDGTRPLDVGRRRHTVDPQVRAIIEDRDRSCRCCGAGGFLHIHHIWHWENGGPTDLHNLVALCPTCHKLVHAGQLKVLGDPTRLDGLTFLDQHGRPLPRPGPLPPNGPPPPAGPYLGPIRGRDPRDSAYTITPDTGTTRTPAYAA